MAWSCDHIGLSCPPKQPLVLVQSLHCLSSLQTAQTASSSYYLIDSINLSRFARKTYSGKLQLPDLCPPIDPVASQASLSPRQRAATLAEASSHIARGRELYNSRETVIGCLAMARSF
ncbi:uncharacterized protein P174DRAFT_280127 [Aspergillus novofumigatus IBT 16806]|uniref:Uncharacterized protein n=1 Tax=Aspergillus novofumigatus (strain IBT 16806) TaxID=1392255 RepID=A0A2I1C031_ASPN1|nr:uncharacterized protein P174DRAFT_280127 [Aspergillus novofumigatus IBT 16806]PKX90996.1 hypothetical protein P174DRAFT_280127 [Aspergillus novofumigatus IBT 16806]